ncbi:MAG: acyltransferase [Minicystis sp.]
MSSDEQAAPRHLPVLDGIRGVAILLVVLFHTAVIAPDTIADIAYLFGASCGFAGVDLFFVLSGLLITGILLDAKGSPTYLRSFYARRALRTLPLYYAILTLALFVLPRFVPADKAARFGSVTGDAAYYWLHLSNVAVARAHAFRHPVLDISWSLAIEEQFYLVWPLVVLACSRRALVKVSAGAIGAALAIRMVMVLVLHRDPHETYVLTPCRMDALAVGALLAALAREPGGLVAKRRAAVATAAIAGPLALAAILVDFLPTGAIVLPGSVWPLATFGLSLIAITFGALLVLALTAPPESALARALRSRVLRTFGKYAYGIYLVHVPARAVIRDRIFGPGWSEARWKFPVILGSELGGQIVFDVICAALALVLAAISYHLFEERFLALKKRFPMR